jgi:hypothetical protein
MVDKQYSRCEPTVISRKPYPSALDSNAFIQDNLSVVGSNTSDASNGAFISGNITALITPIFFATIREGMQYATTGGIAPSSANVDFISKLVHPLGNS